MRLLYATTNQAKLESMRRITKILGVEIIGLNELKKLSEFANVQLPQIDETGNNPLENAIIKAQAYYDTLKIPLFSCVINFSINIKLGNFCYSKTALLSAEKKYFHYI